MNKHRIAMMLMICLMVLLIIGCGSDTSSSNVNATTDTQTPSTTAVAATAVSVTPSVTAPPLQVTDVSVSTNPPSFSSIHCGSSTNIIFSASIVVANSSGGQMPFTWDVNNTKRTGTATFAPGETSTTVSYTLSNFTAQVNSTLSASINVGIPGHSLSSPNARPQGTCTLPGPFQVVGIALSAYPSSLSSITCGATITVVYTATVYIGADSNAGTVQLSWTIGTATIATSAVFAPAQTAQTITYSETGRVFRAGKFPRAAFIASSSPNAVTSATVLPVGTCL